MHTLVSLVRNFGFSFIDIPFFLIMSKTAGQPKLPAVVLMLFKIIKMHEDILELIEKENNLIDEKLKEEECEK